MLLIKIALSLFCIKFQQGRYNKNCNNINYNVVFYKLSRVKRFNNPFKLMIR